MLPRVGATSATLPYSPLWSVGSEGVGLWRSEKVLVSGGPGLANPEDVYDFGVYRKVLPFNS